MSVRVQMPPFLCTLTGSARQMTAEGHSVAEVMTNISMQHPLIARHVFDEDGHIRCGLVFLHDGVLVRAGEAAGRSVHDGDEIVMRNALSGG